MPVTNMQGGRCEKWIKVNGTSSRPQGPSNRKTKGIKGKNKWGGSGHSRL